MSNPTYKPSEGKREEFRKYLEKNGVMDALTKVLVNLYEEPEKPEDALEYIRDRLAMQAGLDTFNQMKTKCDEYEAKIEQLEQDIEQLKLNLEPPPAEEEIVGVDTEAVLPEDVPQEEAPLAETTTGEQLPPQENVEQ
ncbi:hypothetical protein BDFB_003790 [Asbolus verrucosus]|uniref:c-Myc-binding protein n=1 Tax=Asbolus verrucosus TaxID=1661398 RepID=A0A482W5B7_ASBVE|nr:hypothetical protein BDFB_003790 [Asbolus verrucosus]